MFNARLKPRATNGGCWPALAIARPGDVRKFVAPDELRTRCWPDLSSPRQPQVGRAVCAGIAPVSRELAVAVGGKGRAID
jgi:hypothetical protein